MYIKAFPFLLVCIVASLSFNTIASAQDNVLSFGDKTIPDTIVERNSLVQIILPKATSISGDRIKYTLTPGPPLGLPWGLYWLKEKVGHYPAMITGIVRASHPHTLTYTATDSEGNTATLTFTITTVANLPIQRTPNQPADVPIPPTVVQHFILPVSGISQRITLAPFTGGNGKLTYTLSPTPSLPTGIAYDRYGRPIQTPFRFDPNTRVISGTPYNSRGDNSVPLRTYTYHATDKDGDVASATFTIEIMDFVFNTPEISNYTFNLDADIEPIILPIFWSSTLKPLSYSLTPLPQGLKFDPVKRILSGVPKVLGATEVTYTGVDSHYLNGDVYLDTTFTITVVDALALEVAAAGALPSVGANVAQVATEAISTRVGLALDGQSQGLDIRTPQGQQFKLGSSTQSGSSSPAVRFGAWYSTSHDELSNTQTDLAWSGVTDSTNVGIDIGFDLSSKASLVFGVMQNASTTSATYGDANGNKSGLLDVDLDATTFYVGFGYDWLDVWFANGSANSMLNDSARDGVIPTSFAYQTVGLTAAFDFTGGLQVGAKVESLTSALSLSSREALNYAGLESDSSQFRTAFFVNYKLDLGKQGNAQFIPKFEMGYRGLTQNSNSSAAAASAGTAAETSFGVDYLQKQLNLTIGFSIRSFEVQNYASESTQWHIRWESSTYDKGLSLQLRPTVVAESLGLDALYNSDYSQYQSLLSRQYGGDTQVDDDGLDFEMGYGITSGGGTYTPYVKTTNFVFGQAANNSRRTQEVGIRYTTPSGLDLTLAMERLYNPVSSFSSQSAFGVTPVLMQRENSLEFSTRYNF